ncbi:intradiol ring-cleavage dioxygenase [Microbacterium aurantiacum]|uniref:intradiol ring-cleavage dioxygenase n=1 Tax=Microbacterium aurantiacum TaxID=162393 RepID=UPI000C7FFA23|nr:intradiol ring-cleavage dioxygenase [Microbacterium aurantiacum]
MGETTTDPRWIDEHGNEIDEDHRGLVHDIRTMVNRRRALGIFGGVAATALLAACAPVASSDGGSSGAPNGSGTPGGAPQAEGDGATVEGEVPDETAGPYPADGSNGVNVLDDSGIVRRDIRSSFGSSTTTAEGIPLEIVLTVRDAATGSAIVGAGVYLWHCDRAGNYSLYSDAASDENYLRGVQETDDTGTVRFTSIYPGCYDGRWPHIHFEVYGDVATAVATGPIVKTSQIALPEESSTAVYATGGYENSVSNASRVTLAGDLVFSDDGGIHQIATMTGGLSEGYTAALTIGV